MIATLTVPGLRPGTYYRHFEGFEILMIRTYCSHAPRIHPSAFIHDSSEIIGRVSVGRDSSIWPFAVLRGDVDAVRVGSRTNIQDHSVLHCREGEPAVIGSGVTIGHQVVIHGSRIGDGCLIGMGAVIMEATVGRESLVAAGALVPRGLRIPARSLVMGSPARVVRKLKSSELRSLKRSAKEYVRHGKTHQRWSRVVFP